MAPVDPPATLVAVVAVVAEPTESADWLTYSSAVAPELTRKTCEAVPMLRKVVVPAPDW